MNQGVKYKRITYGSGAGQNFLDEASFPAEDDFSDFKFGQAYTNWLMLIETVADPVVEQGWHAHHKHMVSDRGFQDWVQAWCAHNHLLHSQFMLKPFILDVLNPAYEKQFEWCKLDQALLSNCTNSHDYMRPGSQG